MMHVQAVPASAKLPAATLAMCRGLEQHAARDIVAISSLRRKAPGEMLFSEGDAADSVYEVVRGTLRLCRLLPDGRRQIIGFPTAGHLLGFAPEGTYVYTAEAITEITLCRYPRSSIDRLVENVPGLARRLLAVTSDELRFAQDQVLLLGRKTAPEKVASLLLMLADEQGRDELSLPMTRSDMGDYLGLTIETVSRIMNKLKRERLIAMPTPDRVTLVARAELERVAAGDAGADD